MKAFITAKKVCCVPCAFALLFAVATSGCKKPAKDPHAKLSGRDAVDLGGHLDFDARGSKYAALVPQAAAMWNAHKPGIIRPDALGVLEDVVIVDVYLPDKRWAGVTDFNIFGNARIRLNTARLDAPGVTDQHRQKTIAHELGHALGLAENDGSLSNVMAQGQLANVILSADDKACYDAAAARY